MISKTSWFSSHSRSLVVVGPFIIFEEKEKGKTFSPWLNGLDQRIAASFTTTEKSEEEEEEKKRKSPLFNFPPS